MAQATFDINTPTRHGRSFARPVAANVILFAGALAALNATGYVVKAADAANLKVVGRIADGGANNTGGVDGAISVEIEQGVFGVNNSATDAVTIADIGKVVYIEDDNTIRKTVGTNSIKAGKLVDLSEGYAWIDTNAGTP